MLANLANPKTALIAIIALVAMAALAISCSAPEPAMPAPTSQAVIPGNPGNPGSPAAPAMAEAMVSEMPRESALVAPNREVVRTVEVAAETVVVEKEVVREVQVPGQTVVVEREVVKTVEVAVPGETVVVETEGFNVIGGTSTVNDAAYDLTFFKHYGVNPFIDTDDDSLSTFAVDVDTASYSVARAYVNDGYLPEPASVRVEEFVNAFDQGYAPPAEGAFAIRVDGAPSPFGGDNRKLMRVGLQGKTVSQDERKDATLIFAIDVSGSMDRGDRLELAKRALRMLTEQLRQRDEVGIVTYGDYASVLLEPTNGGETRAISGAIDSLYPGGSTYAEAGLRLAYEIAAARVRPGRVTRVILLSDGVANVGDTGPDSILKSVRDYVDEGVTLTTVGFGMGNYNDILMERLANDGDGTYHYVDTAEEARRLFVQNLVGTLQNIAKDAKTQVVFDEDTVRSYRLLGYENRDVADEDFRNDAVDAGEIGAGHSVTALYELKLQEDAPSDGKIATIHMRWADPDNGEVTEIARDFRLNDMSPEFEEASPRFQLSAVVAEYAELLRESYWAREGSLETVAAEAARIRRLLPPGDLAAAEFATLTARAAGLAEEAP